MSIDRVVATTRIPPRAPWLVVGGAVIGAAIGAAVWSRGAPDRWTHGSCTGGLTTLHVEVGPRGWHVPAGVDVVAAAPLFARPEPELRGWAYVQVEGSGEDAAARFMADGAREAFVEPVIEPAAIEPGAGARDVEGSSSCPTRTPSYGELQGYLGPAPGGIDAAAVWSRPGGRGQGVRFADIEGAWNTKHEDLPGDRMRSVASPMIADRSWEAHGTAVVGEVAGRDNQIGMTGIAPDVDQIIVASIGRGMVADAIDRAQQALRPGDVLLIELQGAGPDGRWIPVEYWPDVFEAIQVATQRGVVVIEAAGNGGADLDARTYRGAFDPDRRDSGAVLVGAGGPPRPGFTDRARLDFSNYGRRVDVQGWGRKVATLDYGDLQRCGNGVDRHYTGEFSGTSSASPIVAGAAVQLEAVWRARGGQPIAPALLRDVLRTTGSPQVAGRGAPLSQHIGPRPDVSAALARLAGDIY
jgi:subtilisin family serine protease